MASSTPREAEMAATLHRHVAEVWSFCAVGWLITVLRTYARIRQVGFKRLQGDDYLVWVAAIFYAFMMVAAYSVGSIAHGLANNGIDDEHRLSLSPGDSEYERRVNGSKIQLIGWSTYSATIWSLKAAWLFFYLRLFLGLHRSYRISVYVGFGLVSTSWMAFFLTIVCQCRPFHRNWQIYPDPGNTCHPSSSVALLWLSVTTNVTTDLYIMCLPLPMLWESTISRARKLFLIGLFSGGLFVIACAILRTSLMLLDPVDGASLAGSWSVREAFVATVATSLPAIFPLLKHWLRHFAKGVVTLTRFPSTRQGEPKPETNARRSAYSSKRRAGTARTNPIGDNAWNESEEHIVDIVQMHSLGGPDYGEAGHRGNHNWYNRIQKDVEIDISSETHEHPHAVGQSWLRAGSPDSYAKPSKASMRNV